jgi:hypothetical protein
LPFQLTFYFSLIYLLSAFYFFSWNFSSFSSPFHII